MGVFYGLRNVVIIYVLLLIVLFISLNAFGADLTFTIPNEKLKEYVSDYCYVYPNTRNILNPAYISEEDTPGIEPNILKYTDTQWLKQHIKEYIIDRIKLGKQRKYRDEYQDSIVEDIIAP